MVDPLPIVYVPSAALLSPVNQAFPAFPVIVSGISVFVSYFVAKMEKKTGAFINSGALQANASEAFLDIGTSLVVLAGILLAHAKIPYIEGSVVIFIALLIIRLGVKNIWTPILILMDASLDPELQSEIEKKISSVNGVKGVRDVKIRQSGPFKMVECDIATAPSVSVYKAHELTDKIETLIARDYSQIESVFVHVEPARHDTISAIIPVREINGLDSKVHGHFGRAPYFIILRLDNEGAGLVHDIGRFTQFAQHGSFRDADKLGIMELVLRTVESDGFQDLPMMLPYVRLCRELSPEVLKEAQNTRSVSNSNLSTLADFLVMIATWFYDLNYLPTLHIAVERDILFRIQKELPETKAVSDVFAGITDYTLTARGRGRK